ncbi:hypothetical protein RB195_004955 [Necator americanus]|uniref:Uncharacterized protein n=1 Tax=Necator americanus TaxID=51031 RepID=A0ABR1BKI2_NECAM
MGGGHNAAVLNSTNPSFNITTPVHPTEPEDWDSGKKIIVFGGIVTMFIALFILIYIFYTQRRRSKERKKLLAIARKEQLCRKRKKRKRHHRKRTKPLEVMKKTSSEEKHIMRHKQHQMKSENVQDLMETALPPTAISRTPEDKDLNDYIDANEIFEEGSFQTNATQKDTEQQSDGKLT